MKGLRLVWETQKLRETEAKLHRKEQEMARGKKEFSVMKLKQQELQEKLDKGIIVYYMYMYIHVFVPVCWRMYMYIPVLLHVVCGMCVCTHVYNIYILLSLFPCIYS